jgi:hypothetical protein
MGIAPAFLIKHARPLGLNAADTFFSKEFQTYLTTTLKMTAPQVAALAKAWASTALKDPARNQHDFIETATAIAHARWSELYSTNLSTILFVTTEQLGTISAAGEHGGKSKSFVVDFSGDPIALAVTVQKTSNNVQVATKVTGIDIGTDANGNVFHLAKIES